MRVFAIDPGPEESAWCVWDGERVESCGIEDNRVLFKGLMEVPMGDMAGAIEMVQSFGMAVGAEVFETCWWTGRFCAAWCLATHTEMARVFRRDVKLSLCGTARAKDSNVRQALIDRFGGSKRAAIGVKKAPGPLYGVRSHVWSALAVAVVWLDTLEDARDGDGRAIV